MIIINYINITDINIILNNIVYADIYNEVNLFNSCVLYLGKDLRGGAKDCSLSIVNQPWVLGMGINE